MVMKAKNNFSPNAAVSMNIDLEPDVMAPVQA